MKFGLILGLLVVVIHHSNAVGCGCGYGHGHEVEHGHGHPFSAYDHNDGHGDCACGFAFPQCRECPRQELPHNDWCCKDIPSRDCVPLVVRPHDLPKPLVNPNVERELSQVVANPCAEKKAIVKPAVLPKPVCKAHGGHGHDIGYGYGYHGHHESHSCCGSLYGAGPCYGNGPVLPGVIGHGIHGGVHGPLAGHHGSVVGSHAAYGSVVGSHGSYGSVIGANIAGGVGLAGGIGVIGTGTGTPRVLGGPQVGPYANPGLGPFNPADSVSLDIAYKLAQEADIRKMQSEDKLHFGFRKLPIEMPPKKVVQASNVPEEGIFSLNGQVVELRPVIPSRGNSPAALAEEADEELLALQEEEAEIIANEGPEALLGVNTPIRKVSLCEIGYGVAKPPQPNLVEVPHNRASVACGDISTNCGCGHYGHHHHGCGGYGCGQIGGCATCGHNQCDCKIIPGDVEFQTRPKPQQFCLPPPVLQDDCESPPLEIEEDCGDSVKCACVPICLKQHHCNHSCKKSCILIDKLLH